MLTIAHLHVDLLTEILSYVPGRELVVKCRLVCQQWRELVDGIHVWKLKCVREGYFKECWETYPADWSKYYILRPLCRNLLKNPCAEEGFADWTLEANGGDEWAVEEMSGEHTKYFPEKNVKKYFVTSYELCTKSQKIDLLKNGLWENLLDIVQPKIVVSDWYAARRDCGCTYQLKVQLLCRKHKVIVEHGSECLTIPQWNEAIWNQITHVFTNYGPGVRYVKFIHEGQDTQFWAGWYGIRVTNSSVTVEP
uniref:F-box only protein 6 n=1 Tax=Callorhinchus milii TaxID=7868 RepID=A0A4W3GL03_CALMI|eukprot:gi/632960032/ref/XP_007895964.1/ PREDICTED: F-box only protein 44 [Callorhinchus milii]